MKVIGAEYLQAQIAAGCFTAKMVFNQHGAIIFPTTQEHRDQKLPGVSYEDEHQGSALAAMIAPCASMCDFIGRSLISK